MRRRQFLQAIALPFLSTPVSGLFPKILPEEIVALSEHVENSRLVTASSAHIVAASKAITDLLFLPSFIGLDYADIRAVLTEPGVSGTIAVVAVGEGKGKEGDGRAVRAADAVIRDMRRQLALVGCQNRST